MNPRARGPASGDVELFDRRKERVYDLCDRKGAVVTTAEALDHALNLYRQERMEELVSFAGSWLETHPEEIEIWKLYGAALDSLGHERESRRAFLCALELDPRDGSIAVSYITSCLSAGDVKSAGEATAIYFNEMTHDLKASLADRYREALGHGLLRDEDVPEQIRLLISGEPPPRPYRSPEEASRALLKAAAAGEIAEAERAWEDGADLDVRDRDGWQPIHLAIQNNHIKVADWLLQFGADPSAKGPKGTTPLELARANPDLRFTRLLEGYFPKIQPLAAGPFATYGGLVNEIYETLTGLPARAVRCPEPDDFEDLQVPGVAFGLTRAELATDVVPVLLEILSLKPWDERPEDFAEITKDSTGRVGVFTLEWIELPEAPLAGSYEEADRQLLSRYTRNIDAIARLRLVTPRRLERLLGALYYEDREEPNALGWISPVAMDELFGPELEFVGWERMKTVLIGKTV